MIHKFSVHRIEGDEAAAHLRSHLPDLRSWRDYYVEVRDALDEPSQRRLAGALCEPLTERVEVDAALAAGMVQVAYQRGIVDNESESIVALCAMHGIDAVAAKVAITYASSSSRLAEVVEAEAFNGNIEELHRAEPRYETLLPFGTYQQMEVFDLRPLDDEALAALGKANGRSLELDKVQRIKEIQVELNLPSVSDAMLEALDARWSDHCAHTTWKSLGNLLGRMVESSKATANPNIVSMFHDNAGIWDFYDGYGIAVKAETHNGPSAVSAYFGQLTKVGGVLRDILGTGKGADPIGVFEYTATGLPGSPSPSKGRPAPKKIAQETIRAVKEYGNTFGVPMMSSHMTFHPAYRAKPFALGGSIGLIPLKDAQRGTPVAGDHVVLIGGLTGSDGIHGASASSAGASMDTTAVQIGSPLEEIKFREAILELRDAGCIRAITDLGAAGLNSAVGEMGEATGVWLNTALVPLKTGGLPMWRILLSESQERMALAIAPERLADARHILDRHEVRNTVVGRFTHTEHYCVVHDADLTEKVVIEADVRALPAAREVGFDLPYRVLTYRPPARAVEPPGEDRAPEVAWPTLSTGELPDLTADLLGDCEVQSQWHASSQYDSSVGGRTYYGPEYGKQYRVATGYYAGRPVYGHDGAIVVNSSFNPWLFDVNPVQAARQHFLSVLTGQVLAGVDILDVCLCDNFYTPHLAPDADAWLVAMVEEVASLAETFRTPFISGKDSSAGSVHTDEGIVSVPPAVYLSALGKVPTATKLRTEQWQSAGNVLAVVGLSTPSPAGTAAARALGLSGGRVDEVDVAAAREFLDALAAVSSEVVVSGRVIGAGGALATASLVALASDLGARLEVDDPATLLQEHRVGALVELPEASVDSLPPALQACVIGRIVDGPTAVEVNGVPVLTDAAVQRWSTAFEEALA